MVSGENGLFVWVMLFVFVYLTGVQQMMLCGLTTVTISGAGTVAYHTGVSKQIKNKNKNKTKTIKQTNLPTNKQWSTKHYWTR
jgi:sensor histidine kinase regulating citrate/malate metabolism